MNGIASKVIRFMSRRIPRWVAKYAINRAVRRFREKRNGK